MALLAPVLVVVVSLSAVAAAAAAAPADGMAVFSLPSLKRL